MSVCYMGDDGEGFHRWGAEAGLAIFGKELAQPRREFGFRDELPSGGAFADSAAPYDWPRVERLMS